MGFNNQFLNRFPFSPFRRAISSVNSWMHSSRSRSNCNSRVSRSESSSQDSLGIFVSFMPIADDFTSYLSLWEVWAYSLLFTLPISLSFLVFLFLLLSSPRLIEKVLTDFNGSYDYIQVKGTSSQYSLQEGNWIGGSAQDTAIFYNGDAIGVVQDNTNVSFDRGFFFCLNDWGLIPKTPEKIPEFFPCCCLKDNPILLTNELSSDFSFQRSLI